MAALGGTSALAHSFCFTLAVYETSYTGRYVMFDDAHDRQICNVTSETRY